MIEGCDVLEITAELALKDYEQQVATHKQNALGLLEGDDFEGANRETALAASNRKILDRARGIINRARQELGVLGIAIPSVEETFIFYSQRYGVQVVPSTEPPVFHPQAPSTEPLLQREGEERVSLPSSKQLPGHISRQVAIIYDFIKLRTEEEKGVSKQRIVDYLKSQGYSAADHSVQGTLKRLQVVLSPESGITLCSPGKGKKGGLYYLERFTLDETQQPLPRAQLVEPDVLEITPALPVSEPPEPSLEEGEKK